MTRKYTVLRDGVVHQVGTFDDLELLHLDFPRPEYQLVLDEHLPFPEKAVSYQDHRRLAYPPLSELADALVHQMGGNNDPMERYLAACAAVKATYPKP